MFGITTLFDLPMPYAREESVSGVEWSRRKIESVLIVVFMFVAGATSISWYNLARGSVPGSNPANPTSLMLNTIPDWNGNMQDSFVNPNNPSSDTLYAPVGVPVQITINNLDSVQNMNFSGKAEIPFTVYSDNGTYTGPRVYTTGQDDSTVISHSFTTQFFSIPLPPSSMVTFTYTFTKAGVYRYWCIVPCGPGMGMVGYMSGQIIVQ